MGMTIIDSSKYKITLRAARENSGLNLDEYANALGLSKQTVINYEKNVNKIPTETLIAISELSHIPFDLLVYGLFDKETEA